MQLSKQIYTIKFILFSICIIFVLLYFKPWNIFLNQGEIFIFICDQQFESNTVWEYEKIDPTSNKSSSCQSSLITLVNLSYKADLNEQKVIFSSKEIGEVNYKCEVVDRNNFNCPDKDIAVKNGATILQYNHRESAIPKWRYYFLKMNLIIDTLLNRQSTYQIRR